MNKVIRSINALVKAVKLFDMCNAPSNDVLILRLVPVLMAVLSPPDLNMRIPYMRSLYQGIGLRV